jgi:hypothetical protein
VAVQAVRVKRSSAMRDALPDEAFMRLRGSLFFGPAFLVTRNKLTFRDNLQELLASSSPGLAHPRNTHMCISLDPNAPDDL